MIMFNFERYTSLKLCQMIFTKIAIRFTDENWYLQLPLHSGSGDDFYTDDTGENKRRYYLAVCFTGLAPIECHFWPKSLRVELSLPREIYF